MPELKIRPADNVSKRDYKKFVRDLGLFLKAFTPQLLSEWMKKDKGNISKKLNGVEPITRNDIRDFYATLSSVITKLRSGIDTYQIELEMLNLEEAPAEYRKNLWEEVRLIKEKLQDHDTAIQELRSDKQIPPDAPKPQNPQEN